MLTCQQLSTIFGILKHLWADNCWHFNIYEQEIGGILTFMSRKIFIFSWVEHEKKSFVTSGPGYLHPVCSELENKGIRVAVGDCSVTEHRQWCPPYQTGKPVHVHANTLQTWRTAPGVRDHDSKPLSHSGNVVTRTGLHTSRFSTQYNL